MTPRRRTVPAVAMGLLVLLVALMVAPAAAQERDDTRADAPSSPRPSPAASPGTSTGTGSPGTTGLDVANPYNPYAVPSFGGVGGPPAPVIVGSGADALIQAPDLRGDNDPTLLERYGAQGHSLDSQAGFGGGSDQALNSLAGGLFAIATWVAQIVVATFQWAFDVEVFSFVGDAISAIVGGVDRVVYQPFVIVAVILAGLSMTWTGLLRRRGTLASEQMAWTVFALCVAALFLASPAALVDAANNVSTGLARGVLTAVSVADPMTGPDDGLVAQPTFTGSAADNQLRMSGDRFWRVFVHQPWLVLQFGDLETGRQFGERLLAVKTITEDELAATDGDPEALAALTDAKREQYGELQEEIFADPRAAEWFRGRRAVERLGVASLALAGVLVGGVLFLLVAAATLLAQVGFLLLVLLGPIALLVGIHPGAGRLIALRWGGLLAGLLLKRIVLGALLGIVLVVNGVLLDAAYPLGWLVVMGLQTLVVAAVVVYRKPFTKLLGPTTVPVIAGARAHLGGSGDGSARAGGDRNAATGAGAGSAAARRPDAAVPRQGAVRQRRESAAATARAASAAAAGDLVAPASPASSSGSLPTSGGRWERWRRRTVAQGARASMPTGPSVAELVAAAEGRGGTSGGGSPAAGAHRPPASVTADAAAEDGTP